MIVLAESSKGGKAVPWPREPPPPACVFRIGRVYADLSSFFAVACVFVAAVYLSTLSRPGLPSGVLVLVWLGNFLGHVGGVFGSVMLSQAILPRMGYGIDSVFARRGNIGVSWSRPAGDADRRHLAIHTLSALAANLVAVAIFGTMFDSVISTPLAFGALVGALVQTAAVVVRVLVQGIEHSYQPKKQ